MGQEFPDGDGGAVDRLLLIGQHRQRDQHQTPPVHVLFFFSSQVSVEEVVVVDDSKRLGRWRPTRNSANAGDDDDDDDDDDAAEQNKTKPSKLAKTRRRRYGARACVCVCVCVRFDGRGCSDDAGRPRYVPYEVFRLPPRAVLVCVPQCVCMCVCVWR